MRHAFALITLASVTTLRAADTDKPVTSPAAEERVEVTATKYEEDPDKVAQSITVISGQELRDRGATDLRTALALVAGVDVAPSGDGGPASAIPEMWGLREADAYLLLVDGIPWGGVFNPQISTLSFEDVERIEIMRGAAPVMYGITSFVGVIQVIHYAPGHGIAPNVRAAAGSYGSGAIAVSLDLPKWAGFDSRLTVDAEQRQYKDPRTDYTRGHLLWRNQTALSGGGEVHFGLDGNFVDQSPASPVPLDDATLSLSQNIPLDANYHPSDAEVNPQRITAMGGFTMPKSYGVWSGTLSYAHTEQDIIRGFVVDATGPSFDATGERSSTTLDEVYLDGHVELTGVKNTQIVAGADYQYGKGKLHGGELNYTIASDGSNPPFAAYLPLDTDAHIDDTRSFGGLYGYAAWSPSFRWRFEGGLRLNITDESRGASIADFPAGTFDSGSDTASKVKPGGMVGVTFTAWQKQADNFRVYADYRNTFKPAAVELGLDADAEILKPEEGQSVELGAHASLLEGRLDIDASIFDMELKDVVLPVEGGAPGALENEAEIELKGAEVEARWRLWHDLLVRGAASYHSAKFKESEEADLVGNRQEMTPEWLAGTGILYAPAKGFLAHADVAFTGSRWLDRDNTALAQQFTTWGMGIGWRGDRWTVRLDGTNLNDRRDPVAESEEGPDSYYRLTARRIWGSFAWTF
ncbi:MAG TPA: TonB-dependent receptor plug domain-containing protein [Candidatus Polarisedimenticolaceae bacterium]|nr:TonB-dependent receptor plug domain-containing protein [Candidatus Polarisedimenticolaceae bacterium]